MSQLRLGFIGMGLMGQPMTHRLLAAGFEVTVFNRSLEKTHDVAAAGARVVQSIGELVAVVDVVLLCLADTRAVEEVMFGDDGVAEHLCSSQCLVDFSSSDPTATRGFAVRLKEETGAPWVDAPVSGGVAGAKAGNLAIMCGGDAEDVAALSAVFAPLAARVTHMGPVGTGQISKVCNQMIVGCNTLVIAEMMALAEASGVDASRLPEALAGGFADSRPFQILAPRMAASNFEAPSWHVRTLLKDLDMAVAQGNRSNQALPMTGLASQLFRQHAGQGHAEKDPATLVQRYRKQR